jgi:hypothetical protein
MTNGRNSNIKWLKVVINVTLEDKRSINVIKTRRENRAD